MASAIVSDDDVADKDRVLRPHSRCTPTLKHIHFNESVSRLFE